MYESFFGFAKRPFLAAPTLDRYFPGSSIELTTQTVSRAIQRAEGPVAIFGGTGLGKTMCCLRIADNFRRNFEVVTLASSQLITRRALLQNLLYELRMPYREMSEGELRLTLMNRLQLSNENPTDGLVLIVDEAHTLSMKLLEELRLMTNLVRNGVPRVRLVLCGTMRLEELLAHPHMESLNQRLAARCYLTPLSQQETRQYVSQKIELCGVNCSDAMTREALDSIYRGSDGIPRLIDQLADQSLLLASSERERPVSAALVGKAWSMLQQLPNPWSVPETLPQSTPKASLATNPSQSAPMMPLPPMASTPIAVYIPTVNEPTAKAPSAPIEFGFLDDVESTVSVAPPYSAPELTIPSSRYEAVPEIPLASWESAPTELPAVPYTQATPIETHYEEEPEYQLTPPAAPTTPAATRNLLDVFAGDFDEEFTIPVQSSGSYQAYSGIAYGNLNHDVVNFDGQQSNPRRFEIDESDHFMDILTSQPTIPESMLTESILVEPSYPISNISPEQVASIEAQIEEEMRDLVSNLNMSAMTFDPERAIDTHAMSNPSIAYPTTPAIEDTRSDRPLSHAAHAGVVSFSGLYNVPDRQVEMVPTGDDRDLLVLESDMSSSHTSNPPSAGTSGRSVIHPYAKLFSKLRNA